MSNLRKDICQLMHNIDHYGDIDNFFAGSIEDESHRFGDIVVNRIEANQNWYLGVIEQTQVLKFERGDSDEVAYIKMFGEFDSHQGSCFDHWEFVEPKQVTVTIYE